MNLQQLVSLANYLDDNGEHEEAKKIDAIINKAAAGTDEEEFRIKLQEEGFKDPSVQVGYPEKEKSDDKDELDSMHKTLINAGYAVFRPGELEEWLEDLGYSKELLPKEVSEESLPKMPSLEFEESETNESVASIKSIFKKLSSLADRLDSLGAIEQADMIDMFLKKHAGNVLPDMLDWKEQDDKKYDSEYHHSLQIREPKTDQERVDLEGRKTHHIKNYNPADQFEKSKKEAASQSLKTRYSPDLIGVQLARVGDNIYQCPITGKIYNFETGFTDMDGDFHPGESVAAQTPDSSSYAIPHRVFDSRQNAINEIHW